MREVANVVILIFLVVLAILDWKNKEIPVLLLLLMSVAVAIFAVVCPTENVRSCMAGASVGLLFFVISKVTKEAIGYGDGWLILLLGVFLGGLRVLQILFAASIFSAVCSLFYLWKCHWKRTATIPFVPFLTIAYIGVLLL